MEDAEEDERRRIEPVSPETDERRTTGDQPEPAKIGPEVEAIAGGEHQTDADDDQERPRDSAGE